MVFLRSYHKSVYDVHVSQGATRKQSVFGMARAGGAS